MRYIFITILCLLPSLGWTQSADDLLKRRNHEIHRIWMQSQNYTYGTGVNKDLAQAYAWLRLYQLSLPKQYPGIPEQVATLRAQLTPDQIQRGEAMIPRLKAQFDLDFQLSEDDMARITEIRFQKAAQNRNAPNLPGIPQLAQQLEKAGKTALAKSFWQHYQKALKEYQKDPHGRIVYGRVIVFGPESPREVVSPIEILDEGYFVGYVSQYARAMDFRLDGYMPIQYFVDQHRSPQLLATAYLRPLKPGELAGVSGQVLPIKDAPQTHVVLQLQPTEQRYQSVDNRPSWYWPTLNVPLTPTGQFTLTGLSPSRYQLIVSGPKGRYEFSVVLRPGELRDLGPLNLIPQTNAKVARR